MVVDIASVEVDGVASDVTYACGYTVTVKPAEGSDSAISNFESGDAKITIDGAGITENNEFDLSELSTEKTVDGTFTITNGQANPTVNKVSASLYVENKNSGQTKLVNQNITVDLSITGKACTMTPVGD